MYSFVHSSYTKLFVWFPTRLEHNVCSRVVEKHFIWALSLTTFIFLFSSMANTWFKIDVWTYLSWSSMLENCQACQLAWAVGKCFKFCAPLFLLVDRATSGCWRQLSLVLVVVLYHLNSFCWLGGPMFWFSHPLVGFFKYHMLSLQQLIYYFNASKRIMRKQLSAHLEIILEQNFDHGVYQIIFT